MDNQVTTIVCPNCGASTSNRHNCEYCGSLLVRFADQNKVIDESKYGKEAKAIPGLEDELKKNIALQKTCGLNNTIVTNIVSLDDDTMYQIVQSYVPILGLRNEAKGLAFCIPFQIKSLNSELAESEKQRHNLFKASDCFFLFEPHKVDDGIQYSLDFGEDYTTAAQIISNIIKEDKSEGPFSFTTEMLSNEKLEIEEESGFLIAPNVSQNKKKKRRAIIALICAIIVIIIDLLIS